MTAPIFRRVRLPAGDERAIGGAVTPGMPGLRRPLLEQRQAEYGLRSLTQLSARGRGDMIAASQRAESDLSSAPVLPAQLTGPRWQARMRSAADLAVVPLPDCACPGVLAGRRRQIRTRRSLIFPATPPAPRSPPGARLRARAPPGPRPELALRERDQRRHSATFSFGTFLARTSAAPSGRLAGGTPLSIEKAGTFMSTGITVAIVVAVIVVTALVIGVMVVRRRRRLQRRFGPEYHRVAGERDSKLKAESELAERERRVRDLDIQPLTDSARANYAAQWAGIQERFVDAPEDAVAGSQLLVAAVMTERGYPTEHQDQVLADLSVEHSATLDHYRAAEDISHRATADTASTEDLRQAMIHYRALFGDLLGEPADAESGSAASGPAQTGVADDTNPRGADPQAAAAQHAMAGDPIAARPHLNGSNAGELTK